MDLEWFDLQLISMAEMLRHVQICPLFSDVAFHEQSMFRLNLALYSCEVFLCILRVGWKDNTLSCAFRLIHRLRILVVCLRCATSNFDRDKMFQMCKHCSCPLISLLCGSFNVL